MQVNWYIFFLKELTWYVFRKYHRWYPGIGDGTQNYGQSGFWAIFWTLKMMKIDHTIKCVRKFGYHPGYHLGTIRHSGYHWGTILGTMVAFLCAVKIEISSNRDAHVKPVNSVQFACILHVNRYYCVLFFLRLQLSRFDVRYIPWTSGYTLTT